MKKSFKIVLLLFFTIVLIFSGVALSYLFRPVTNSRKNICGFYAEKENSLNVVYIGGSDCYTYWEPLEAWKSYGFTSYNFALDALQPQVIKYILEEIKKTQSPNLYIIDLRPFEYGDLISAVENIPNMERVAPFRNLSDNLKYSINRVNLIENCAPDSEEKWTYYFDFAKYHNNLFTFFSKEAWEHIRNEKKLVSKGFHYFDDANPIGFNDTRDIREKTKLTESINNEFIRLLDYCKESEIQVLFVVPAYQNSAEDQRKYNYMEEIIRAYGFNYLNTNAYFNEIGLNVLTDFYDGDHVNLLGADKYTKFLGGYINENYHLPTDEIIIDNKSWESDYLKWSKEVNFIREKMKNEESQNE